VGAQGAREQAHVEDRDGMESIIAMSRHGVRAAFAMIRG
jgi:hypothetical protein